MAKKVVRLTEGELRNIVHEVINETINELGYRGAALTHGANRNAITQFDMGINQAANDIKADNSKTMRTEALTFAIHDNFPNLLLSFTKSDGMDMASLSFKFDKVRDVNYKHILMQGRLNFARQGEYNGCIEYDFTSGNFCEYRLFNTGNVRRLRDIVRIRNSQEANALLSFVSNYLYASEEYEAQSDTLNANGIHTEPKTIKRKLKNGIDPTRK